MSEHRAIIETGPGTVRRLCCGASTLDDEEISEIIASALAAVDDQVTLVGERPVAVDSVWTAALRSVHRGGPDAHETMVLVHPSWWSSSRVARVTAAAATISDDVLARPRSWLLRRASDADPEATVVVEIAERLVVIAGAIAGAEVVAVPRSAEPQVVAEEVAGAIAGMAAPVVLIDALSTVAGAPALASSIVDAVRASGRRVLQIDDARLVRLARSAVPDVSTRRKPTEPAPAESARHPRSRARTLSGLGAVAVVLAAAAPAVATVGGRGAVPPKQVETAPATFLVEGRVALTVPANWPVQRIVAGPGSARVQVTSPSDPEAALHLTQSPVAGETLSGTAERLKHAMDAEAAGLFVDFNPSGISAGRPAVTYREVRASHHVRWTVLLDGPVRISIGCQSRPGDEDAVRTACDQAVRSAHAIG